MDTSITEFVTAPHCVEERECVDGDRITECKILKPFNECAEGKKTEPIQISTQILGYGRFPYITEIATQKPMIINTEEISDVRNFFAELFNNNTNSLWKSAYDSDVDPDIGFASVSVSGADNASLMNLGLVIRHFNGTSKHGQQLQPLNLNGRFDFKYGNDRIVIGKINTFTKCWPGPDESTHCVSRPSITYECIQVANRVEVFRLSIIEIITPQSPGAATGSVRTCRGILPYLLRITENYFGDRIIPEIPNDSV